jgi:hypothetical protein
MPGAEIEPKQDSKQVSQDVLVADIERTREDLARTIDAISDRVSPANVARRAAGRVRERVAAVDPVMAGGAVVVVAGLTVAWLLLRRRKRLFSLAGGPVRECCGDFLLPQAPHRALVSRPGLPV